VSVPDALGLVNSTVDQVRFDECVDAGGFGTVYRGRHLGREEPVAIKCLRLSRLVNLTERMRTSIVARFQEETKILHHLSHGTHDIVRCFSSGQVFAPATGEPVPYMVLEWLDGRPLTADLAERRERGIPGRSLHETLDLIESAALAIAHAHTQGIIHRDIKPGNLMLTRTRGGARLKVLDFGLAKILSDEPGSPRNIATADGVHLFSVAYCAPEQLSSSVGEVGPWTDIYSLALVMLEVMRGEKIRHPTTGSLRASSLGITIPSPVEDLLARAVSQNPLERPANANIFWSALRELARQSVPPVSDASALAATAFDGDVAAAMLKVRAATASTPSTKSAANKPEVIAGANPFTGTMLMVNAPSGALHLLSPQGNASPAAPPPARSAGFPPPHIGIKDDSPAPGSTEPLASPLKAPARSLEGAAAPAPPISPHAVTAGLPPPTSPLASSLGPLRSPVARQPAPVQTPHAAVAPPRPPSVPPPVAPSTPPAISVPETRGPGFVVGLLVVLVLAVAGVAGWMWLRSR